MSLSETTTAGLVFGAVATVSLAAAVFTAFHPHPGIKAELKAENRTSSVCPDIERGKRQGDPLQRLSCYLKNGVALTR